jgi:hypothetical protein
MRLGCIVLFPFVSILDIDGFPLQIRTVQGSGVHIHVFEPVRHDGRKTFNIANLTCMEELISRDFKGFDEVVHGDGILTSFIEEYIEIELIVVSSIIVTIGVGVANLSLLYSF